MAQAGPLLATAHGAIVAKEAALAAAGRRVEEVVEGARGHTVTRNHSLMLLQKWKIEPRTVIEVRSSAGHVQATADGTVIQVIIVHRLLGIVQEIARIPHPIAGSELPKAQMLTRDQ